MNRTRIQQIETVLNQSTINEKSLGKNWYKEAHEYAKELSKEFNLSIEITCAIISVFSPLKSWVINKNIAKQFLQGKRNVHTRIQVMKADSILREKNIDLCLGGLKTVNFFHNLLEPENSNWATIDRRMLWIFNEKPKLHPAKYNSLKQVCIDYARQLKQPTPSVQATAWLTIHRLKYNNETQTIN